MIHEHIPVTDYFNNNKRDVNFVALVVILAMILFQGNPGPPGPKGSKGKAGPRGVKVNVREPALS